MFDFGPSSWLRFSEGQLPTPVGDECSRCHEQISESDYGLFMPHMKKVADSTGAEVWTAEMKPEHRECHLRSIFGSVGHLQQKCSCFGGTEEDPPGLTERQAAIETCKMMRLYPF